MGAQAKREPAVTPLAARLKDRIAREGPISVHDYMQTCLGDRAAGYYLTRQPIGREGDFITAPEISQMFGELIGVWVAAVWQGMGVQPVIVADLGPGRGTLLADALRVFKTVPGLLEHMTLALIETSPVLRQAQSATLHDSPAPLQWFERIDDVPQGPLILIANEFVDALPVRQFVRSGGVWRERAVTLGAEGGFAFCEGAAIASDRLPAALREVTAEDSDIAETRPAASALLQALARRADDAPVAALVADYGHAQSGFGDTLQAVRAHRYADPLVHPGETDLTAHVDFAALKAEAINHGLAAHGPMQQGEFLLRLGLEARLARLSRDASPAEKEALLSGAARLTDPRQMGLLFKALVVQSSRLAPPPPFGEI
ncbi:MAG TPA: SAM-dependent methyltransferase [Methyloceanibacter sp.]|nr:SAM-dependent methyltransferase [Methyloceanibacter sp.]